ncbi:tyrosine-type recombinase/integrase [Kandleria vitulina]|uniref:tyrosine-type recombinase/integrase n=1 Tax=Kandleria vitulina TaxID=1630 RepID=UPI0009BF9C47
MRAGRHTASGKCPDNNTANDCLRSIFDFYDFVILEYDNGTALKVLRDSTFVYTNSIGLRYAKTIKTFHGYLPREEYHAKSITEDDLHTLISSARTKRDKLLLLLLEETGFRIGEILGIKYTTDIDFENKKVFVRYRETNPNRAYAKYAEERGARISNSTFDLLMIYLTDTTELRKNSDYLFVSESGPSKGKPLTLSGVNSLFERLEKRCGISGHSHMLRHYFANERRKASWDMAQISTSLGHKNIATTEAYLNVEDDELAEANDNYFVESMKFVDINDFL